MSRGFIKEGDQEEIPMVPPRAHLPKGMPNYVTHEGLEALNNERQDLENQRAEANGNYIVCNFIDAKLKLLADRINSAVEVDLSKADKDAVSFGAWVRYNGRTVRIVGVDEADSSKGLLSFMSPVAKALIGKKIGDTFEIVVPKGKEIVNVQEISFEPLETSVVDKVLGDRVLGDKVLGDRGLGDKVLGDKVLGDRGLGEQAPETPQAPQTPETPQAPQAPKTPQAPQTPQAPKVPKTPRFVPEENIMEFLPVVNERGNIIGRDLYMNLHKGNKILHPVVHLHVTDPSGEKKKFWWHVSLGETPEKTLVRKLGETLRISGVKPKLKKQYIRETKFEKELVYVYALSTQAAVMKTPDSREYLDVFAKD
ncbi:MAG: GreA/GreB family elongation factor [Bacteroidales bacterium]|nr:GreA/GreB family elongation factor [Bacteroidales bacterium]